MLTDWLMESEIPSIRYFTLRHLLDQPEDSEQVQTTRHAMATTGPIPEILQKQAEAGHWEGDNNFYQPKYTSVHWTMLLLAELGADPTHEGMQRGVDYVLDATTESLQAHDHGWECLWGNILYYALYCGFYDDERTQHMINFLANSDDWKCRHNNELPCAWGAARTLWGLAAMPASQRADAVTTAIDEGVRFLLERYSLLEAKYPTPGEPHKLWHKLNYPLFYQGDVLFVLRVLAALDRLDHPDAQPALQWLAARRKANGRWGGGSPFGSRTWNALGNRSETPRWISLQAAMILKQAGMAI